MYRHHFFKEAMAIVDADLTGPDTNPTALGYAKAVAVLHASIGSHGGLYVVQVLFLPGCFVGALGVNAHKAFAVVFPCLTYADVTVGVALDDRGLGYARRQFLCRLLRFLPL